MKGNGAADGAAADDDDAGMTVGMEGHGRLGQALMRLMAGS
jgi:hypothetical protein